MTSEPKWAMYIDGYNFYYAIKNELPSNQLHLAWCDFSRLAREIIDGRGVLSRIKYFTALVDGFERGEVEKARQALWLRAVESIPLLEVVRGFHSGPYSGDPSLRYTKRKEKETDVNIALALVGDADKQVYDHAILVSGDYDQMPAARKVTQEFMRTVEVWLPPGESITRRWKAFAGEERVSVRSINAAMLKRAKLPDTIPHPGGAIDAPTVWRATESSPPPATLPSSPHPVVRRLTKRST
ncbi:MAG: NYN domain-containing protein [Pyrinomonadaceae bacterium]